MEEKEKYAYLAGLIDGEGTITLLPTYEDRGIYSLYLIISNSCEDLINWLKENFGGVVKRVKSRNNVLRTTRDCFNWILRCKRAFEILEKCYPFLHVKKPQAELIFEYRKTLSKGPFPLSLETINKRREIVEKLREVNTGKEYKLGRIEKREILSKCPFCGAINSRPEKKKRGEKGYTVECKNCKKVYRCDYLGRALKS